MESWNNKNKNKNKVKTVKITNKSLGPPVLFFSSFAKGCLKSGKSINKIPKNQAKNEVTSLK